MHYVILAQAHANLSEANNQLCGSMLDSLSRAIQDCMGCMVQVGAVDFSRMTQLPPKHILSDIHVSAVLYILTLGFG